MPIADLAPSPTGEPTDSPAPFSFTPGKDEVDHGSDTPEYPNQRGGLVDLKPPSVGAMMPAGPDNFWVTRSPTTIGEGFLHTGLGAPEYPGHPEFPDEAQPSLGRTLFSAFRQGSFIGSSSARKDWGANLEPPEPGFNPWDAIKGTKYEPHWQSFTDIRSTAGADDRKRQIDMEDEDRKILAAAPWYKSLPANLIGGGADITSLLPGAVFLRSAGGAISIARTAAATGIAAGVGAAAQETGLQATQQTRPASESAMNIGASVFLSGSLGAGGAKLVSRAEWSRAVAGLNEDLARGHAGIPNSLSELGETSVAVKNSATLTPRAATQALSEEDHISIRPPPPEFSTTSGSRHPPAGKARRLSLLIFR
jgi:hypothetical protein